MFTIRLADVAIAVDNRHEYIKEQCAPYICAAAPDFSVRASDEEIEREWAGSTDEVKNSVRDPLGYGESVCVFRKICYRLPAYNALLFHSAALSYRNGAYLFSAPSGTGKTTHLRLWMRAHKDELRIINGDKPILRMDENGVFTVYGTPWAGKERWQNNISAPLKAICFLRRAKENSIVRLTPGNAAPMAMRQILYPKDPVLLAGMMSLTDRLLASCPIYLLSCNISPEAAELSFSTLTGGGTEDRSSEKTVKTKEDEEKPEKS